MNFAVGNAALDSLRGDNSRKINVMGVLVEVRYLTSAGDSRYCELVHRGGVRRKALVPDDMKGAFLCLTSKDARKVEVYVNNKNEMVALKAGVELEIPLHAKTFRVGQGLDCIVDCIYAR